MTLSMTGFALCRENLSQGELVWEMRAVNQRFLDLTVRLPEEFRSLEEAVRKRLKSRMARGKIECTLRFNAAPSQTLNVNMPLVTALLDASKAVQSVMQSSQPLSALDMLRWPGALMAKQEGLEALHDRTLLLLETTIETFIRSRRREGEALAEIIQQRCQRLAECCDQARQAVPQAAVALKQKITARIEEVAQEVDRERLEQELVFWCQKMDVEEELDRLDVHLGEIAAILQQQDAVGRRLDFIVQEMNREANTLGSKAANTAITQIAVEMKVLIEQIREQVQNVE